MRVGKLAVEDAGMGVKRHRSYFRTLRRALQLRCPLPIHHS